ncbi:MarR family winged helix-turn-helix transcriptional regulator [Marinimicrobium sp. ABcell2]|uniref:MarR family winged helix-turn-helix transcriptional regulator n=1 Tax=Marinimicrobium sp. ABcell2 TaxID=3069751 RepID=UPI0027B3C813|nr:MarR family transcriptional regulator [Marinimicrobium sp. ABcell2]MDQ2075483.1 MarR family transcriptional regulator [Marinimicrobium sp. ABcell2]
MSAPKNTQRDFHLHNSFTFWISRLASAMKDTFNQKLADWEVTYPQWMILNVLHHELANTPAQIADNIGVDRSAVTRLLDRLEAKKLVERMHDGLDRRSVKILITRQGVTLMNELNTAARDHQQLFLDQMHPTELRAFKTNVQKLLRAGDIETVNLWRHM